MFITCQQCRTMFRLDEKLLNPTGSKVRCSQCGNLFVAHPPAPVDETPAVNEPAAEAVATPKSEAVFDQELEGIDLAELDSILEQDKALASEEVDDRQAAVEEIQTPVDLNEADLDLDFEAALEGGGEVTSAAAAEAAEPADDEFDLDMDFDLGGEEDQPAGTPAGQAGNPLTGEAHGDQAADDLSRDIDMALDDFEDALGQSEAGMDQSVEISDDDLDLDFELDAVAAQTEDSGLSQAEDQAAVAPGAGGAELDLGDLDALLDEDDTAGEAEVEEVELSLDDGEEFLPDAPPQTAVSADTGDDLDLGDLDALLDEDESAKATEVQEVELSLDDSEAISFDNAPAEEAPPPAGDGDQLDLGDLDVLLEDDDPAGEASAQEVELSLDDSEAVSFDAAPAEDTASSPAAGDELDLSDLDALLDGDDTEEAGMEALELSLDDGGELPVDGPPAEAETPAAAVAGDELDLGDLDSLLDDDDTEPHAETGEMALSLDDGDEFTLDQDPALEAVSDMAEDDDPDLGDLDFSLDTQASAATEAAGQHEGLEELEFELDAEFEDKPLSQTARPVKRQEAPDAELDLSDIEQMLEDETLVPDGNTGAAGADLEGGSQKWPGDQAGDPGLGGEGEIDLSEIEAAIDAADTEIDGSGLLDEDQGLELDLDPDVDAKETPAEPEIEELDLELELEDNTEPTPLETVADDAGEFDLSDLDLSVEDQKASTTTETVDGGDIELEFQIEEDGPLPTSEDEPRLEVAGATAATLGATTKVAAVADDFSLEETIATQPLRETAPAKPVKAPKKRGTSKTLVVFLILVMLGGGGYLGYDHVIRNDIQIPYLSEYINPKPKDPTGTMNLSTLEINSKFLENERSGRLFVVTGKVRNGYSVPCKLVRLRGKLFTQGKVLAKTEHTYAGLVIPDQELASKGVADIKKQLDSTLGAAATVQVRPGQTLPFMFVFSDLPANLDEFAIELVSAAKIQ